MDPDAWCRERGLAPGSMHYYAALFVPEDARRALAALFALRRELDDLAHGQRDPAVVRQRLHWWREELVRARAGTAQHPVARALSRLAGAPEALPLDECLALVQSVQRDLDRARYPRIEALEEHGHSLGGGTWALAAVACAGPDTTALPAARRLGTWIEITALVQDTLAHAARGKHYLPGDLLAQHGTDAGELRARPHAAASRALVRDLAGRARAGLAAGLALMPGAERPAQIAVLVAAEVSRRRLRRLERRGWRLPDRRIDRWADVTPIAKLWTAWRVQARERRRAGR